MSLKSIGWMALLCVLVAGCKVPGARELTVAAGNYEARSLEALAAVDEMARQEIQPPERPEREAEDDFVERMRALPANALDEAAIVQSIRPFAVNTGEAEGARKEILDEMRRHHAEFTAIFADVERAGILSQRTVGERVPQVLDILIAQQLRLARTLTGDGRPRLLGERGALGAEIHRVRLSSMPDDQKSTALRDLRRRWIDLEAREEQLLASTSGALLRAAATGLALREQVERYGQLSLAQIQSIVQEALGFVTAATGRDLSALSGQVDTLIAQVEADPDFSAVAKRLLDDVEIPQIPATPAAQGDR